MFKIVSYTIKTLDYNTLSTTKKEPTKEEAMVRTALLSQDNWQEIFCPEIILFGCKDKSLSAFWKTEEPNFPQYLMVFIPETKSEGTKDLNMPSALRGLHWLQ